MKNSLIKWRVFFVGTIVIYFLAVGISIVTISKIPNTYVDMQKKESVKINTEIKEALSTLDINKFNEIIKEHFVDFTIYNRSDNSILYTSLDFAKDFSMLQKNVNEQVVSSRELLKTNYNNIAYEILVVKYYISPQSSFDIWLKVMGASLAVLLSIIVIALLVLFNKYIKPLNRLKDTIKNISTFQLNLNDDYLNNSEYDRLSHELLNFSKDLNNIMYLTGNKYNKLEQNLIIQNENITYKNRMIVVLAHDLKAPLSLVKLKLESLKNKDNIEQITQIQNNLENLIININEINQIAHVDRKEVLSIQTEVDLIKLIISSLKKYDELYNSKDFYVDVILDEDIKIIGNFIQLKQVVNNLLNNIYFHAPNNANVTISCYEEGNNIIMSFYNDCNPLTESELNNIFNLFYSSSANNNSSGIGMYTIKSITSEMNGKVSVENYANGILVKVVLSNE